MACCCSHDLQKDFLPLKHCYLSQLKVGLEAFTVCQCCRLSMALQSNKKQWFFLFGELMGFNSAGWNRFFGLCWCAGNCSDFANDRLCMSAVSVGAVKVFVIIERHPNLQFRRRHDSFHKILSIGVKTAASVQRFEQACAQRCSGAGSR